MLFACSARYAQSHKNDFGDIGSCEKSLHCQTSKLLHFLHEEKAGNSNNFFKDSFWGFVGVEPS